MSVTNELKILGIKTDRPLELTKSMINNAYKVQSLKVHPDKNRNDPHATEKMTELNRAREVLINKARSGVYSFVPSPPRAHQPQPRAHQPAHQPQPRAQPQSTYNFGEYSRGYTRRRSRTPSRSPPRDTRRRSRTPSRSPPRNPQRNVYERMEDLLRDTEREYGYMPNVVSNDSDYDSEDDILRHPRKPKKKQPVNQFNRRW